LTQPKVWDLNLIAISDSLLENSIIVPDSISPSRNLEGSKRIKEAGSKPSKTSISKSCVTLLLIELFQIITHVHQSVLELVFKIRVHQSILESTTHQKFKGEIVNFFGIICL